MLVVGLMLCRDYIAKVTVVFGLRSEGKVAILPVKVCREGGGITPCIFNLGAE